MSFGGCLTFAAGVELQLVWIFGRCRTSAAGAPGTLGLFRLLDGYEVVCCLFSGMSLESLCFKGVALTEEGGADDLSFLLLDDFFGRGRLASA